MPRKVKQENSENMVQKVGKTVKPKPKRFISVAQLEFFRDHVLYDTDDNSEINKKLQRILS